MTTESQKNPRIRPAPMINPAPAIEPAPPVPIIRAVVHVASIPAPTARGRASVNGAIDPALRAAPPYAPPPKRAPARPNTATPEAAEPAPEAAKRAPEAAKPAPERAAPVVTAGPAEPAPQEASPRGAGLPKRAPGQSEASSVPNTDVSPRPKRLTKFGKGAVLPVATALLAAFVGATGYLMTHEPPATGDVGRWTGTPPEPAASEIAPFAVPVEGAADPFGTKAPALTGVPTRLKVKAIGIDTSLETLRIGADGELTPPRNFAKAGFYADGTLPGDIGPAVIAGHVDSKRGPAVFYRLRELQKGDRIEVVRGGRTVRFRVTATAWYPKKKFPTEEVYGPTPDRQLRLITCGGVFDHTLRSYKDNLVVHAVAG